MELRVCGDEDGSVGDGVEWRGWKEDRLCFEILERKERDGVCLISYILGEV